MAERIFNVVRRGPRTYLRLNRETILIARYVVAARRLAMTRWRSQKPPNFGILSNEIELMLAKREKRAPQSRRHRRWKAVQLVKLIRWFTQFDHPLIRTTPSCAQLRCWPGAKGSAGIDPYSLQKWAATSARPFRTPLVPWDFDL